MIICDTTVSSPGLYGDVASRSAAGDGHLIDWTAL